MQREPRCPMAGVLTLTGAKRTLGRATGTGPSGCCTRTFGRWTPAILPAPPDRPLSRRLDLRYRP